jgi:hypothetical protein
LLYAARMSQVKRMNFLVDARLPRRLARRAATVGTLLNFRYLLFAL